VKHPRPARPRAGGPDFFNIETVEGGSVMEAVITPREGLRERDYKHHMKSARKRFKLEKRARVPNAAKGFRSWARKTYLGIASMGKLLSIVGGSGKAWPPPRDPIRTERWDARGAVNAPPLASQVRFLSGAHANAQAAGARRVWAPVF
jgi:hypothetical protein